MPIAFVQSASVTGSNNVAFTAGNTQGNAIIAVVAQQSSGGGLGPASVSDTNGNSYLSLGYQSNIPGTAAMQIFFAFNIQGDNPLNPPNRINVIGGSNTAVAIHEFSGINALDQSASGAGAGNAQSSGNVNTGFASELLFGCEVGSKPAQLNVVNGPGWTAAQTISTVCLTQYQIVAARGVYASTTTTSSSKGSANNWVEQIGAFCFVNPETGAGAAGGVSQANVGLQLYPGWNGIAWTQPGGKNSQVFPAQARNQPMVTYPVPGQVIDEVGMSLWPVWGCGHGSDVARIFKDFDPTTGMSAAVIACPVCTFIQYLIEPYENATSSIAMTNMFPIIIP